MQNHINGLKFSFFWMGDLIIIFLLTFQTSNILLLAFSCGLISIHLCLSKFKLLYYSVVILVEYWVKEKMSVLMSVFESTMFNWITPILYFLLH